MRRTGALAFTPAVTLMLWVAPAFAVSHQPVAGPSMATIAAEAESVTVVRLDPEPAPRCFWDYTDSLRFTHCYDILEAAPSPGRDWTEDLADLLSTAKMYAWNGDGCGYTPQAIVKFVAARGSSNLVVLTGRCDSTRVGLLLIRPDAPMAYREIGAPGEDLLDMLADALAQAPNSEEQTTQLAENTFVYYDEEPAPLTRVDPVYPEFAEVMGLQGKVTLHVLVGRDGLVKKVRIIHGIAGLNDVAISAVQQWRFRPAMAKGVPVEVWAEVPMDFHH